MTDSAISAPETQGGAVAKVANAITQKMGLMYGIGMMFFSGWNQMLSSYWNYFLTNAVGMDPALMGTMTTISSFAAWIIVFIAAIVIERIWLRWGQYLSLIHISLRAINKILQAGDARGDEQIMLELGQILNPDMFFWDTVPEMNEYVMKNLSSMPFDITWEELQEKTLRCV